MHGNTCLVHGSFVQHHLSRRLAWVSIEHRILLCLAGVTATNSTQFHHWFHDRHSASKRSEWNRCYSTCAMNFNQVCTGGRRKWSLGHQSSLCIYLVIFSSKSYFFKNYFVLYHIVIITAIFDLFQTWAGYPLSQVIVVWSRKTITLAENIIIIFGINK